jgi:N-acetylornithine carbamoyltransferase
MSEKPAIAHLIRLQDLAERDVDDLLDLSARIKRRAGGFQLNGKSVGLLFFPRQLAHAHELRSGDESARRTLDQLTASSDFWDLETTLGAKMDGKAPEHVKDAAAVLSRYVNVLGDPSRARRAVVGHRPARRRHPVVGAARAGAGHQHGERALASAAGARRSAHAARDARSAAREEARDRVDALARAGELGGDESLLLAALRAGWTCAWRIRRDTSSTTKSSVRRRARRRPRARASTAVCRRAAPSKVLTSCTRGRGSRSRTTATPRLSASRRARAGGWMIDEALMKLGSDARLMHAMPVRRNLEVTDEVLDGPRSLMYDQAENRLHTQKAVLVKLNRA